MIKYLIGKFSNLSKVVKLGKFKRNYRDLKSEIDYKDAKAILQNIKLSFKRKNDAAAHDQLNSRNLKNLSDDNQQKIPRVSTNSVIGLKMYTNKQNKNKINPSEFYKSSLGIYSLGVQNMKSTLGTFSNISQYDILNIPLNFLDYNLEKRKLIYLLIFYNDNNW